MSLLGKGGWKEGGGGCGGQVFNALIYTSKPPWHRIVLREKEGAEREGKGNEGGFISSLPLRAGKGWKSMRRRTDGIMMVLNQSHEQMGGLSSTAHRDMGAAARSTRSLYNVFFLFNAALTDRFWTRCQNRIFQKIL